MAFEQDRSGDSGEMKQSVADCAGCGHPVDNEWCGFCGLQRPPTTPAEAPWPEVGEVVAAGEGRLKLKAALRHGEDHRRFLAEDGDGQPVELVIMGSEAGSRVRKRRAEARALLGDLTLSPTWAGDCRGRRCVVTALPQGTLLGRVLRGREERSEDSLADRVARWAQPLVNTLARLHDQGVMLGALDPDEILITEDGRCVFIDPAPPLDAGEHPQRVEGPMPISVGFSAPEIAGHCGGAISPATDVFFAGMVLYYLVAGVDPLEESIWPTDRLPNPNIYRLDAPPDLVAVIRRATSPIPSRRYADVMALRAALAWAMRQGELRSGANFQRLRLEIGHELHIGVLKGQYNPQNQDDMFLAWDHLSGVGLFLIADGVSISEYGTGDLASACVREEAFNLWGRLRSGEVAGIGSEREGGPDSPHVFAAGRYSRPGLPLDGRQRRSMMREMLDRANARIGERVHQDMPTFTSQPMGIMASTAVGALVDGNGVTLMSIGDSRIYLIREGHIISLMADHDLATQLLRFGRTPSTVRQVSGGGALVRCVGEFEKNDRDRLVPVPLQPDFRELRILPGDTIVLCSDGIPDYAGLDEEDAEDRMRQIVERAPGAPWAAFELMVLANRGGGGDNISCVVLSFGAPLPSGEATPVSVGRGRRGGGA